MYVANFQIDKNRFLKMPPNKKVKFQTISVDNTSVNFPFEPYDLQINYMHKVSRMQSKPRLFT